MKLFYSGASPFARKVVAVAHEVGLADRIEVVAAVAHPVQRNADLRAHNPLGQVPTLVTDAGVALADSRVIAEYLDDLGGGRLFPPAGEERWRALALQSLADGLLDAALLCRYELTARPEEKRFEGWLEGQRGKIADALAAFEGQAGTFGDRVDIGTLAAGCALGYLDLRFPDIAWRDGHPALRDWFARFDERPSMRRTRPSA